MLTGTEVKSLRSGKATIAESYASAEKGELFLINATIPEYGHGNRFNHEPKRPPQASDEGARDCQTDPGRGSRREA